MAEALGLDRPVCMHTAPSLCNFVMPRELLVAGAAEASGVDCPVRVLALGCPPPNMLGVGAVSGFRVAAPKQLVAGNALELSDEALLVVYFAL